MYYSLNSLKRGSIGDYIVLKEGFYRGLYRGLV